MRRHCFFSLFLLIISLLLVAFLGCSATKSVVKKITPKKDDLKKRVMILPIIDQAGLKPGMAAQITADFVGLLKESPYLSLYGPPKDISWPSGTKSPLLGLVVAHDKLIEKADDLGLNAIITGVLNPVESTTKKTGIWPFRKFQKVFEVCMVINVMDMSSRTLLLSKLDLEEIFVDEEKVPDQMLRSTLTRILKRQASSVVSKLMEEPWKGKILAIDNATIKISAGKDTGLKPGYRFEVFSIGESIPAKDGRSLILLGKKVGEIKVTSIMEKHSIAVPVEKGPFMPGQIIRFRH